MKLSNNAIRDFKGVYLKEFKVKLSNEEANKKGLELLMLIKIIYQPIPKVLKA